MLTFNLHIFEDHLLNSEDFIKFLNETPADKDIVLSTQMEGPSLRQCGVVDILLNSGRDLTKIKVETSNTVEDLPIEYVRKNAWSHWFQYCKQAVQLKNYRSTGQSQARLGCFIGRKNLDRLAILYCLSRRYKCFLSSLREDQIHYEHRPDLDDWVDNKHSFETWVREFNIPSLDNFTVSDQYRGLDLDTSPDEFLTVQLNMLKWYNSFDVELVCETFVRGDTYFPTEKTVRPIIGAKPMLIYGPKNFLARLREQGFKTWDGIWSEEYDKYEGIERWNLMKPIINQMNAWGDWEWKPILEQANQIANYNKQFFFEEVN